MNNSSNVGCVSFHPKYIEKKTGAGRKYQMDAVGEGENPKSTKKLGGDVFFCENPKSTQNQSCDVFL